MRSFGSAAQLILMNGPWRAGLRWWMALAISSLPVPFSPWISTLALLGGDRLDQLEQLAHRLALADDVLEGMLFVQPVLEPAGAGARSSTRSAGAFEHAEQAVRIEVGLLDEVEGPGLPGLERPVDGALAADDDHLGALVDAP